MKAPTTLTANEFKFVFPEVLCRLDYSHKLAANEIEPVELPDCREVVEWYFTTMTDGAKYEREINQAWNTSQPHMLVERNFKTARFIRSMGWSYDGIKPLLDRPFAQLENIPPWADLFETTRYDSVLSELVFNQLYGHRGIQIANACKLLYQKRPRLVPILDLYARQTLNVPYLADDADEDAIILALRRLRIVAAFGSNPQTLANLTTWLRENPHVNEGLTLSWVRLIDILAWGVVRQREWKVTEESATP